MKLMISVFDGSDGGYGQKEQIFSEFPISIGRLPDNDIVIIDKFVSRRHCEILASENSYILNDLGSTNGSLLNSELVCGPIVLRHQDIVKIGPFQLVINMVF